MRFDCRELWPGYGTLAAHSHVYNWLKPKVFQKRGRGVSLEFDDATLNYLLAEIQSPGDGARARIGNVAYTRTNIIAAGRLAQKEPRFKDDKKVQKFSDGCITCFLKRTTMHRRRLTSQTPCFPSPEEIRTVMGVIPDLIRTHKLVAADIVNADETGVCLAQTRTTSTSSMA